LLGVGFGAFAVAAVTVGLINTVEGIDSSLIPSALVAAMFGLISWFVLRATTVRVEARDRGLRVVNYIRTYDLPWEQIDKFTATNGYWGVLARLHSGRTIALNAVQKSNVSTWSHRETWADVVADELNDLLQKYGAGGGLSEASVLPSQ
jgi:hypothetical protein